MHHGGRGSTSFGSVLVLVLLALAPAGSAAPRYEAQVMNPDLVGGRVIASSAGPVLLVWGSDATILRSENGRDWRHARTPGAADLTRLAADDAGAVLIAVGAQGTVLRSVDAGWTWQAARNRVRDTDLTSVVFAGQRTWIAAGTAGRILRSTDDGKTWSLIDSHLGVALCALTFDAVSGRVFVGGDGGVVGFSTDRGESWQVTVIAMPEPVTPICGFHRFGAMLLATSARGRFLTSEEDGTNWDLLQSSSQARYTDAAWDPDRRVIVMTGDNGDLLRSTDGGHDWQGGEVVLDGRKNLLGAIQHDPRAQALLVIAGPGVLARSSDGGITWARATNDLHGEPRGLMHDAQRGALVAYGAGGLLAMSTDSAAHWTFARDPLDYPRDTGTAPTATSVLESRGVRVSAGPRGKISRSVGGSSWKSVDTGTTQDLHASFADARSARFFVLGANGTLLESTDLGKTWRALATHTTRQLESLAVDGQTGDLVLGGERTVRLVRQ